MNINIPAEYASITFIAEVCEPWIELWGGDEWGESMVSLHGACHTSYGFSDEDCALFASKLLENLIVMKDWVDEEGYAYDFWEPEYVEEAQERCRDIRDYWLKGGNLRDDHPSINSVKVALEYVPGWVFGE